MADPSFSQAARRSYLVPVVLALLLLAAAAAVAVHFYPATSVAVEHLHTDVLPNHTVYKSKSIVLGPPQAVDTLLVVTTLRVDNRLRVPIDLDTITCTLTDPTGAVLTVPAISRRDLPNLEASFPAVTALLTAPLLDDASIDPGHSATGPVVFSFPFTATQWKERRSATIKVNLYHQYPFFVEIPKLEPGRPTASPATR